MENMPKTKNKKLSANLCLHIFGVGVGGVFVKPVGYYLDCKFNTTPIIGNYRGTNLAYDMLCENYSS